MASSSSQTPFLDPALEAELVGRQIRVMTDDAGTIEGNVLGVSYSCDGFLLIELQTQTATTVPMTVPAAGDWTLVDVAGRWFICSDDSTSPPSRRRISLRKHRVLAKVLRLLADAHRKRLGPITVDQIAATVWDTQERLDIQSGRRRVYTLVNRLRTLGLGSTALMQDGGYFLAPSVRVIDSPPPVAPRVDAATATTAAAAPRVSMVVPRGSISVSTDEE